MNNKDINQSEQFKNFSSSSETSLAVSFSAEDTLREINSMLLNYNYEFSTLVQAILGVAEMHIDKQDLPNDINSALIKIHESATMLGKVTDEVIEKIREQTRDAVLQVFPMREKRILQDAGMNDKRVAPVRMPYGRVLIVDDLELNLSVTKGLLEFYELHVETVLSGQVAIDKIQAGAVYDIVLMDLMMPEMDGITAMRSLRKLGYAMPIIAFTANSTSDQDEACLQHGFDGVLLKPIQLPLLDKILHNFIRNRHPKHVVEKAEEERVSDKGLPVENQGHDGCILIIGEDVQLMGSLAKILSNQYIVKASRKVEDCVNLAIKHSVDLILLDVALTDYAGYKVLDELKSYERTRNIPVIVVSKDEMEDNEARALVGGAVDFLRRPFVEDIFKLRIGLHMHQIKQMRAIENIGMVDSLTGANNRRSYETVFESEWNRAARSRTSLGLLMIDIDHFKPFNDKYGHLCGDEVLKSVAEILITTVKRGSDYVFRWGGEEFAVILPETTIDGAHYVAESIRKGVEEMTLVFEGQPVNVTVSIGVSSIVPAPLTHPRDSFVFSRKVDDALYSAKNQGRNRVIAVTM